MIAHLLRHSGYGCNAFLGGISVNYQTNFWSSDKDVCIAEADEYDRSFLKLSPDIAVISAMDADHLDIYGDAATMEEAFVEFTGKLKPGGLLVSKFGLKRGKEFSGDRHFTYSLYDESADARAMNITMHDGSYRFDAILPGGPIKGLVLNMGGMHNVENAIAAVTIAQQLGINEDKIKEALAEFKGVRRRFEYVIKRRKAMF